MKNKKQKLRDKQLRRQKKEELQKKKKKEIKKQFEKKKKETKMNRPTEDLHALENISLFLKNYSLLDVTSSVFIAGIWLPNISSWVKFNYLMGVVATLKPSHFQQQNQITSYQIFSQFLTELLKFVGELNFFMLEDYIPTPDWGEVQFHHNGKNYPIFFGTDLTYVYEYLSLYQLLHLPIEQEYQKLISRSPKLELKLCLELQSKILSGIKGQPQSEPILETISPGYVEVPPLGFWQKTIEFYQVFNALDFFPKDLADMYSIQVGDYSQEHLHFSNFANLIHEGDFLAVYFLKDKNSYFPLFPRQFSSILFDQWGELFSKNYKNLISLKDHRKQFSQEVIQFIQQRYGSKILPFSKIRDIKNTLPQIELTALIPCKEFIFLLYALSPTPIVSLQQREFEEVIPRLQKIVDYIQTCKESILFGVNEYTREQYGFDPSQKIIPQILILIPQISTSSGLSLGYSKEFSGQAIFIDQFLGLLDSIENEEELSRFWKFYQNEQQNIMASPQLLDVYFAFKSFDGVIAEGADDYDSIILSSTDSGVTQRFRDLSTFWKHFPDVDLGSHPRCWEVKNQKNYLGLSSKKALDIRYYTEVGNAKILITSSFENVEYRQGMFLENILLATADSFGERKQILEDHRYFQFDGMVAIQILPHPDDIEFVDLHQDESQDILKIRSRQSTEKNLDLILLYDEERLPQKLLQLEDATFETQIIQIILEEINAHFPDSKIEVIQEELEKTKKRKPRFKAYEIEMDVAFPDCIDPWKPGNMEIKKARKRIAELAKQNQIKEGFYELEKAKEIVNFLKEIFIHDLNMEIQKLDYQAALPLCLEKIDGLSHQNRIDESQIVHGATHETDYDTNESYTENHNDYIKYHRAYRFLIEKFVQLQPSGEDMLTKDQFQYLIAVIDWLLLLYYTSDSLHHEFEPIGIQIHDNFLLELINSLETEDRNKKFQEEEANLGLEKIGNLDDCYVPPYSVEEFVSEINHLFLEEYDFSYTSMLSSLIILKQWGKIPEINQESPYYQAKMGKLQEILLKSVEGLRIEEIEPILSFLTLRQEEVLQLTHSTDPCSDLPVWEHRKRFSRYTIRPLIYFQEQFYWGPYSAKKSIHVWNKGFSSGTLPTDLNNPQVEAFFKEKKRRLEEHLVIQVYGILQRYTNFVEKEFELCSRDRQGKHPQYLGDYDILTFIEEKNVILNIECKHVLAPYCVKDTARLHDKIFKAKKSHVSRILRRQDYLVKELDKITHFLNWPIKKENQPRIIPIHLSPRTFPWTRFPKENIEIEFLKPELLSYFIESL